MEVIVLAGGLGTRLRSVVKDVPKCMAPVGDQPFLYYLLHWLKSFEVDRVILSVGYLREVITEWINDNRDVFPYQIDFVVEDEPLGTGGGIRLALESVKTSEAVILNGDTFFDVNLDDLLKEHQKQRSPLSIALKPMTEFDRYGSVVVDNQVIQEFKEKEYCKSGVINGGIYVIDKQNRFFDSLPAKFSFESDVLQPFSKLGMIYGFTHDRYFIDIGIPEDYEKANQEEFLNLFA